MKEPNVSDESQRLFAAARAGDDSALWRLTEQFRPYLKSLVRRELGPDLASKVDDSDVVQQSMIRAANKFSDFHGENVAGWQGWLVAITRNEAKNTARYWRQQRRDAHRDLLNGDRPFDGVDESTPSKVAVRREQATRLLTMIEQLPEDQQQLVEWRYFENSSHKDIASRLGITEVAARQRARSALTALHKCWNRSP